MTIFSLIEILQYHIFIYSDRVLEIYLVYSVLRVIFINYSEISSRERKCVTKTLKYDGNQNAYNEDIEKYCSVFLSQYYD